MNPLKLIRSIRRALKAVRDINLICATEGNSVCILCDNPEAETIERQSAVECACEFTGWIQRRFYGRDWQEALSRAAARCREFECLLSARPAAVDFLDGLEDVEDLY